MTEYGSLSREVPLVPRQSGLLIMDVQNFCVRREGSELQGLGEDEEGG